MTLNGKRRSAPAVRDRDRKVLVSVLTAEGRPAPGLVVTAGTPLAEGGFELNSLELIRALVRVEELLEVRLDDAIMASAEVRTVGDLAELVARSRWTSTP